MDRRRLPGIEKQITSIEPSSDVRVKLLGTIIDLNDNAMMLDDGSGKLEIGFDENLAYLQTGQMVRVIARIFPLIDGFQCKGEVVQVLNNFDINLYRKAKKIIQGD